MFRQLASRVCASVARQQPLTARLMQTSAARLGHGISVETDETTDDRYIEYFDRPDIDSWELRKGLHDLHGHDMIPEPRVMVSVLRACRRLNDISLAIRFLEASKDKCGSKSSKAAIWPYIMQEIGPEMAELGIPSLEQLGYDKPELWLESHEHSH